MASSLQNTMLCPQNKLFGQGFTYASVNEKFPWVDKVKHGSWIGPFPLFLITFNCVFPAIAMRRQSKAEATHSMRRRRRNSGISANSSSSYQNKCTHKLNDEQLKLQKRVHTPA